MRSKTLVVLLFVGLLAFAVTGVQAQITSTTLVGTVSDSTGAVVPGAQVSATNVDTNFKRTVQSNGEGAYRLEFLPVGSYKLEVTATGFKAYTRTGIVLEVAQIAQADVTLQIGKTGETGLAAGDHLHYGVYLDGVAVLPVEWWDQKWIDDNVIPKLAGRASEETARASARESTPGSSRAHRARRPR